MVPLLNNFNAFGGKFMLVIKYILDAIIKTTNLVLIRNNKGY